MVFEDFPESTEFGGSADLRRKQQDGISHLLIRVSGGDARSVLRAKWTWPSREAAVRWRKFLIE